MLTVDYVIEMSWPVFGIIYVILFLISVSFHTTSSQPCFRFEI